MGTVCGTAGVTIRNLLRVGFEALDQLNVGFVVTDVLGQVLLANSTANRILSTRDGLELTSGGALSSSATGLRLESLHQSLKEGLGGMPGQGKLKVFTAPRGSGKRALTVVVRPVVQPHVKEDLNGPAALMFILDPELPADTAEAELRQLYGLTSAEGRLARLLMEGRDLGDCCTQLCIRRSTAKMHLRHLFLKTAVQRQSELVSLLFKSVGLIRTRSEHGGISHKFAYQPTASGGFPLPPDEPVGD